LLSPFDSGGNAKPSHRLICIRVQRGSFFLLFLLALPTQRSEEKKAEKEKVFREIYFG
jgi:hypothetical protein